MYKKLKILHLENNLSDVDLVKSVLSRAAFDFTSLVIDEREKFIIALKHFVPDIIFSNLSLPFFKAHEALKIVRESGMQVPFIIITTAMSDEYAVDIIKCGADDYILKDRLERLPAAVTDSLERSRLRIEAQRSVDLVKKSEKHFRTLIEHGTDAVAIFNRQGDLNYLSPSVKRVLGYDNEDGLLKNLYGIVHPDDKEGMVRSISDCLEQPGRHVSGNTSRMKHHSGQWLWMESTFINLLDDPAVGGIINNFRDVTESMVAKEKLIHATQLYDILSQINKATVHAESEQDMFVEACRIAVNSGKFVAAWIGMLDTSGKISPVEVSCLHEEDMPAFQDNIVHNHIAQKHLLHTGMHYVCNNVQNESEQLSIENKYASLIALPLTRSGIVTGSLNLYSAEPGFFNAEEISMLNDATTEISFALNGFEKDRQRISAERSLALKEMRTKQAQAIAHLGNWNIDFSSGILTFSEEALRIHGLAMEESQQTYASWLSFIHPEDLDYLLDQMKKAEKVSGTSSIAHRIVRKDGAIRHVMSHAQIEYNLEGIASGVYGVLHDITEQKEAEEELRRSESNLQAIFENTNDGFILADSTGIIKAFNNNSKNYIDKNIGKEVMVGSSIYDYIHETRRDQYKDTLAKVLDGQTLQYDKYFERKDGDHRWYTFTINPVFRLGKADGFSITSVDITERKKTDQRLLNSELNLKAIIDNTDAAIFSLDKNYRYITFNPRLHESLQEIFGLDIKPGDHAFEFLNRFDPAEALVWKDLYSSVLKGETLKFEKEYDFNDFYKCLSFSLHPIIIDQQVIGLTCFSFDITKQKLTSNALNKSEFRYRQIVETMQEGIWTFDENHSTNFVNAKMSQILGYSFDEMMGRDFFYFMDEEGKKNANEELKKQKQSDTDTFQFRFISKSGQEVWTQINTNAIYGDNKTYKGAMSMVTDITEKILADNILRDSEQKYRLLAIQLKRERARLIEAQAVAKLGSWEHEMRFQKITWSPEMYSIFNVDAGSFLPTILCTMNCVSPGERLRMEEAFETSINNPSRNTIEHKILTGDGQEKYVIQTWKFIRDDSGNPIRAIGTCQDITEQKLAGEKLRESDSRYRHIVETAQEGIWLIDENNRTTFVNNKMTEIFGYSKEEMMGKDIYHFMDDEAKQKAVLLMEEKKTGRGGNKDFRYVAKSGKTIWTNLSANPIFDNGIYKGALAMVTDITEKKRLEMLLDRANRMAMIGSFEADLPLNTLYWSPITREIYEVDADYVPTYENSLSFYTASCKDLLLDASAKLIEGGVPLSLELQIVTAKGNERWIRILSEGEFRDGQCIKLTGSFQDIDARKRAELELMKVFEEKNNILESIQDGFYALDKDWTITYWNREAEVLLGRKRENVVGKCLWDEYPDIVNTSFFDNYHKAAKENKVYHFEEYYETLKMWADVSVYPSSNGLSVYFRDITERKLYEIKLRVLNQELVDHAKELAISNKELEQFAYVTSHDLQEPLRMVTSFLTLIEKKYGNIIDEKGKQYIHFAVDGAKRMRQIILDLLEFSRVGKAEFNEKVKVDINEVLHEITAIYRKQIEETGAVIKFKDLPSLEQFRTPLHQVFKNLIANALIYRKAGTIPIIEINSIEKTGFWEFSVKDNGIGIEKEYFEKIFVMFQRLHNKDEFSGTGIGLAICKKIVENLRGRIWVESEPGVGSTFYFTVPVNKIAVG